MVDIANGVASDREPTPEEQEKTVAPWRVGGGQKWEGSGRRDDAGWTGGYSATSRKSALVTSKKTKTN